MIKLRKPQKKEMLRYNKVLDMYLGSHAIELYYVSGKLKNMFLMMESHDAKEDPYYTVFYSLDEVLKYWEKMKPRFWLPFLLKPSKLPTWMHFTPVFIGRMLYGRLLQELSEVDENILQYSSEKENIHEWFEIMQQKPKQAAQLQLLFD